MLQEELRHHSHLSAGWGEHPGPASPQPGPKTSSAFSPLQSSIMHTAAIHSSSSFGIANRVYAAFYDPISFSQAPTKVNFGEPSTNASNPSFAGPQQLLLSEIKNHAHNPTKDGLFKLLSSLSHNSKVQHLGQPGAAQ